MKITMMSHKQQSMIEKKKHTVFTTFFKTQSVIQETSGPSTIRAQNSRLWLQK